MHSNHLRLVPAHNEASESVVNRNISETIKNMPRWRKFAGWVALTGTLFVGTHAALEATKQPDIYKSADTTVYTVERGDTAWKIAENLDERFDGVAGNMNTVKIIADMEEHNPRISNMGNIYPGDTINIPDLSDKIAQRENQANS